ncbi:hypothetical protein BDB01DRAFT_896535 [Pilobolus umbonatus]|nr:hypothetical protein BDB01DRAFT_896535 [Pilobolus umbonatus]
MIMKGEQLGFIITVGNRQLPLEVILQILNYLPYTSYSSLYTILPQGLVDEAILFKLRSSRKQPLMQLVSTNRHELSSLVINKKNESSMNLYFTAYDISHRLIWTIPDFGSSHHFFRVKDAYVSHGKLVLRPSHDTHPPNDKPLVSLWDIRETLPPTRAGSFSGASEFSYSTKFQELTIHQGGCIVDSCLLPVITRGDITMDTDGQHKLNKDDKVPRPSLPSVYSRKMPIISTSYHSNWIPTYNDSTCGYFLVERLGISIPAFLELFS